MESTSLTASRMQENGKWHFMACPLKKKEDVTGFLCVDSSLNIRKFTEYIGREFQLMEHDVGRSLQIFAHSFPDEDIIKDAGNVLKDLVPIDREVTAMNGRFYTLRIAPYRTTEKNIRGLVITIIDSLGVKD